MFSLLIYANVSTESLGWYLGNCETTCDGVGGAVCALQMAYLYNGCEQGQLLKCDFLVCIHSSE